MLFLKEFFEKVSFEKNQQTTKNQEKIPACIVLLAVMKMGSLFYPELLSKYLIVSKGNYFLLDACTLYSAVSL